MPIKRNLAETSAPETQTQSTETTGASPRRGVPSVNAKLDDYIARSPDDFARYTKLVKEDPAYAVRSLMLKDMNRFTSEIGLVAKQLPEVKNFLASLSKDDQMRIMTKVEAVDPMFRDSKLVREVKAHMDRQSISENRKRLMPKPGAKVAA